MVGTRRVRTVGVVIGAVSITLMAGCGNPVTTYHYDNLRTGWNPNEPTLTAPNISSATFGLLYPPISLDDQVDTQPLVVPYQRINGVKHDWVVYVATENDTIYAIDPLSGAVLLHVNFGKPVQWPVGCNNNGPNVGIDGTPVIDLKSKTMYVITYTMALDYGVVAPEYFIHALDLSTLKDRISPVLITAHHAMVSGGDTEFHPAYQRQRAALLLANGNVYAAFASFCDWHGDLSRGWVLGWKSGSLTPLPTNQLNDRLLTSPNDFFLSSVWMSGYGLAADSTGNLYFVTGNSDHSGTTYDGVTNVQESVVQLLPDLTQPSPPNLFTPSNVGKLDQGDTDFGSGGVLLLPDQPTPLPHLAAAAGKDGRMFLLNRDHLGGYAGPSGPDNVVGTFNIGGCWCGQSYFTGPDGLGRIVSSGGSNVTVWRVQPAPSSVTLVNEGSSAGIGGGQEPGFFTSVSSNGNVGAVIWAVSRPSLAFGTTSTDQFTVSLYAFQPNPPGSTDKELTTLFKAPAGTWLSWNANANIVPVAANGQVYVASYKELDIFGFCVAATCAIRPPSPALPMGAGLGSWERVPGAKAKGPIRTTGSPAGMIYGTVRRVYGSWLDVQARTGRLVQVDATEAMRAHLSGALFVGESVGVPGTYDRRGVLHAERILRVKPAPGVWPPDR